MSNKKLSEIGKHEMKMLDDANELYPRNPPKYWYTEEININEEIKSFVNHWCNKESTIWKKPIEFEIRLRELLNKHSINIQLSKNEITICRKCKGIGYLQDDLITISCFICNGKGTLQIDL